MEGGLLRKKDPIVWQDLYEVVSRLREGGLGDFVEGKKFLISGGAGFLGSWLVDALFILGAEEIVIIDNLSTGSLENVEHLLPTGKVKLIRMHVENFKPTRGYDYVLHFAARPSPEDYMKHPVETLRASSIGTENMLETARHSDAVFLLASTSEVYGHAETIPTPENYWGRVNPVGPRSCYDEGKRYAEALSIAYMREYGLDIRISRTFNTYGPRLDWRKPGYGRVVTKFIVQALSGREITIYGDGQQTRSFLYVSDNIDAHIRLLGPRRDLKGAIVNIGSDEEITILELAKLIIKLTGSKSRIIYLPPRPDDPPRRRPDIGKASRLLGWRPTVKPEEGLNRTIKWISKYLTK